jgi:hypothetical protein
MVFQFLKENGLDIFQSIFIVAGFWIAARTLRGDERAKRVSNLLALHQGQREIWNLLFQDRKLSRVLESKIDLKRKPATFEEKRLVKMYILNLLSAFEAERLGQLTPVEGASKDIAQFFTLPIVKSVWKEMKPFQNKVFIEYVEQNLRGGAKC